MRLIAGALDGHAGPGVTHTPITYAHATVSARRAQLDVPWNPGYTAMVYVLSGRGFAGSERRPLNEHELVVFGPGDVITLEAAMAQPEDSPSFEVLLLGGVPLHEPIAHYGPFLMNTRAEILQALEDYQAGRMGVVPTSELVTGQ